MVVRWPEDPELSRGEIYRDLDGTLVHMVALKGDLCRWSPLNDSTASSQVTHRSNFLRRFRRWGANQDQAGGEKQAA